MDRSAALRKLREIFGSDGSWILVVLAIVGLFGTFAAFGWVGFAVLVVVLLLLLVIVFAKAALSPKAESQERPAIASTADPAGGADASAAESGEGSSGRPEEPGESPARVEDTNGSEVSAESSAFQRGLDAMIDRDIEKCSAAFDEWIAETSDSVERLEREGTKLSALVRAGDSGAMERLRGLADENLRNAKLQHTYARALAMNGATQMALDQLTERSESVADPDGRSMLRLAEARLRLEVGESARAKAICLELLESSASSDASTILAEMAATEGEDLLTVAYYERALSTNPTDANVRFSLAYAASQAGMPMLAVYHYGLLEASGVAKGTAINNLGVALDAGGASGLARDYWRRASKMGSALAAGNLANAAALAGFLDEAEGFVKSASADDDSPRIGEALQRIAQMRVDDHKVRQEMEEGGQAASAAMTRLVLKPAPPLPTGEWTIDGKNWAFELGEHDSEGTRGAGTRCRFFVDAGSRLRFELRESLVASTISGYAVPTGDGQGILLVALASTKTRERLIECRPSA